MSIHENRMKSTQFNHEIPIQLETQTNRIVHWVFFSTVKCKIEKINGKQFSSYKSTDEQTHVLCYM